MKTEKNIFKKSAKMFFIISLFMVALALANATLIEKGTTPWDVEFENIWNISHNNGTIIGNASILRIGNISNILNDAFKIANYSEEYAVSGFDLQNYSSEYASTGFKLVNFTTFAIDANIANDLTIATTKDITIGGGFGSGGITLTTSGSGNFRDILLAGNLTLVSEGEVNGSINPASGISNARLGNASNQWASINVSGNSYTNTLTAIGNVDIDSNTLFVDSAADRVGIGTTAPNATLSVAGNMTVTGVNNTIGNMRFLEFNTTCNGFRSGQTGGLILSCTD